LTLTFLPHTWFFDFGIKRRAGVMIELDHGPTPRGLVRIH
jgi:hypothetical protein